MGVKYARGKYIAFVDSDDFVSDTMYGKLIAAAERDHSNVAVCRVMRCYDKDSEKWVMEAIDRGFRNLTAGLMNIKETPALVYNSYVWNKLIRKDFYLKHAFSFPLGMNYEDNPVMIPMQYLAEDMSFVPDTAYYYRIRRSKSEDNLSITQDEKDNNVPDYLKSMKMTLDSLYAINTEKNVIDALIDKFISHDIYGLLNPGSIVHMMNTTLLMDQIRHTVCQCFSADDISRQNLLTQKRITAFMEGDYKKLGELNEFISAYEKTQTYSSEEHILRSLPPKLFGVQHETVIIDSLTYGPSTKLYLTDWTGENCLCHSYLYYPRISVTEKDKPEYSVFMQNLTTLEEIDLPTKSEIRCDAGNIQEISDYDQSISSFDYSGSGFSFLLNPEVSRHIPAGDRYALAVRYETP